MKAGSGTAKKIVNLSEKEINVTECIIIPDMLFIREILYNAFFGQESVEGIYNRHNCDSQLFSIHSQLRTVLQSNEYK